MKVELAIDMDKRMVENSCRDIEIIDWTKKSRRDEFFKGGTFTIKDFECYLTT